MASSAAVVIIVGALIGGCTRGTTKAMPLEETPAAGGREPAGAPAKPTAPSGSNRPHGRKGTKMAAEALLLKHYADKSWGKPTHLVPFDRVPFLYRADFSDGEDYALVHDGKIVEAKGLDAMASYMKDVKLMSESKLDASDVTTLLLVFDAYPPVADIPGNAFYVRDKFPRLKPKLELGVDEGRLTLNYLMPHRGGAVANPHVVTVKRWTLDIPKSYKATWHEETVKFDTSKP